MIIQILKTAITDIKEIHDTLNEYGNEPQHKFRLSFNKFCDQVVTHPFMYPVYQHALDYRRAVLEYDYLLFYKVDEKAGLIKIYRVVHNKRNIRL